MAKKVYAVKEGFDSLNNKRVENKIVNSWAECLAYVKGVKGAKYKSFERLEEAQSYLNDNNKLLKKGVDTYPEDGIHVYVDGSYNSVTEKFSYGLVVLHNDVVTYMENGLAEDNSEKHLRQILGELRAATRAIEYAISLNEKKVLIFHDYEGIYHHAVGTWDRKDPSSKQYYEKMNSMIENNNLEVIFVKIDSHTGDIYNEIADNYAKLAASMDNTKAVDKWLSSNVLKVKDAHIKDFMHQIIGNAYYEKVVIEGTYANEDIKSEENIIAKLRQLMISDRNELEKYIRQLDQSVKDKIIIELLQ